MRHPAYPTVVDGRVDNPKKKTEARKPSQIQWIQIKGFCRGESRQRRIKAHESYPFQLSCYLYANGVPEGPQWAEIKDKIPPLKGPAQYAWMVIQALLLSIFFCADKTLRQKGL
ncbi:hypothetical protein CEXT_457781 [Caerostris extrusa]|uniref:Uncharacterized protein n=1 Tax=Caerostris extrusa TaxID=172846 RepID=A0AAV4P1U4_CAEEX|nr:hypothetical protein CEXT_457781 [Caerostris extrusa]